MTPLQQKNYEEKTTKKGLDLKFNMFCTFKTMKDLNLALYMNLGDSDASKTGEKSSHTSRGMGEKLTPILIQNLTQKWR